MHFALRHAGQECNVGGQSWQEIAAGLDYELNANANVCEVAQTGFMPELITRHAHHYGEVVTALQAHVLTGAASPVAASRWRL